MSIYISSKDKEQYVSLLSEEIRNDIMIAVEASLNENALSGDAFQDAWNKAFNSRVCDLEDLIELKYADEKLSFYVVENLRFQQDKSGSFNLTLFDKLEDAIKSFNEQPKEYTSALGASLSGGKFGIGEIDLVHRKNGEPVQVNDFKFIERWNNPLVKRAIDSMNYKLGVEYESDLRIFGDHSVLVPLQEFETKNLNSYFLDKYLNPSKDAELEVSRRYGDLSMYSPSNPIRSKHLLSAINEIHIFGVGWLPANKVFKKLNSIDEHQSPERLKVTSLNINYIDLNGRVGQADISPYDFALLKKQTIERTAQKPHIDVQIEAADKVRAEQMEKKDKNRTKDKGRDKEM